MSNQNRQIIGDWVITKITDRELVISPIVDAVVQHYVAVSVRLTCEGNTATVDTSMYNDRPLRRLVQFNVQPTNQKD